MQTLKGLVLKSTGRWYVVKSGDEQFNCSLRGNFRLKGIRTTNPIAVGDKVEFTIDNKDTCGQIISVADRKNVIIRKATKLSKATQLIAANIDLAIIVVTPFFPRTSTGFIDRFLVSAESYNIEPLIVFNKVDLFDIELAEDLEYYENIYNPIGYNTLRTSTISGEGIELLKNIISEKTVLFMGHSGVGKSALINSIDSSLNLKTGDISHFHLKGKHTTTFAEMHPFNSNGYLIDTPGIKEFGVIDFEEWELGHRFPDFRKFIHECKYTNCTHVHEPNCAIIKAVEEEKINPERYKNYLGILKNVQNELE